MLGRTIGFGFATARDFVARGLIKLHISPNMLTLAGVLFTLGAGACFALGGGSTKLAWSLSLAPGAPTAYPLLAGALLVLASACDMLDGAVARIADKGTRFGAFLDSSMDRLSDFAVYAGIALYYARQTPANLTFVLLSMLAFFNAFMISYARARAEDLIDSCSVGYWQRGERSAAILIGTFAFNAPAMVLQQAILPALTVLRRITHTRTVLAGRPPQPTPPAGPWHMKIRLWRWRRMSIPYDVITALNIAWLILAPLTPYDPIRQLIGG